jgi:hypothetical protein
MITVLRLARILPQRLDGEQRARCKYGREG